MNNLYFIEELATKLRERMEEKLPKDFNTRQLINETLKSLGGRIIGADDPEYNNIYGMLRIYDKRDFIIKLNLYTSPLRDNSEIAIKIGRYILSFLNLPEREKNIMANRFAAALIMPRELFVKAIKKYNSSVSLIAAHFQVPTDFVAERLKYCY